MSLMYPEYQQLRLKKNPRLHQGADGLAHRLSGYAKRCFYTPGNLSGKADLIHHQADKLRILADDILKERIQNIQYQLKSRQKENRELVCTAISLIVEAADRKMKLRPFPVQIMAALAMQRGFMVEMATGEGKTLAAAMAAIIAGWQGGPCHIITTNDYLTARDAELLSPLYSFCRLTTGYVTGGMDITERIFQYSRDVVYTTSKEILADFLKDRIKMGNCQHPSRKLIHSLSSKDDDNEDTLVMRGIGTAIIDEADSILIDEAVTPLIISRQIENRPLKEAIKEALQIAGRLKPNIHYTVDRKYQRIILNDIGQKVVEKEAGRLPGMWQCKDRREELLMQTLQAREFYHRNKQYVVKDNKIIIVDEFTGRLMPDRTWSHGLHQAVEVKEGLDFSSPSETVARLSFQRFFRFFHKLSGMTGTAREAVTEFWQIYRLQVIRIPTNRPCIRKYLPDQVFALQEQKLTAIINAVLELNKTGRPVLIGTRNVYYSELLAKKLVSQGVNCQILNAVRHKKEASLVARAGEKGNVTIATNMAGRGTDIKLGSGVAQLGGLHVIVTERHESIRIDRQLFGRCARQGDPGSVQAFISMEDEIVTLFVPKFLRRLLGGIFNKSSKPAGRAFCLYGQKTGERLAFKQRKIVLQNDTRLSDALSFAGTELNF